MTYKPLSSGTYMWVFENNLHLGAVSMMPSSFTPGGLGIGKNRRRASAACIREEETHLRKCWSCRPAGMVNFAGIHRKLWSDVRPDVRGIPR